LEPIFYAGPLEGAVMGAGLGPTGAGTGGRGPEGPEGLGVI